MRYLSVAFLVLMAAHGPLHHHSHHPMPVNLRMGSPDGISPRDFNRTLGHVDKAEFQPVARRLDRLDMGNGANLGVGFIGGRHMGLKLKLPF